MNRERMLDWLARLILAVILGGYVIYLADLYIRTGGHW